MKKKHTGKQKAQPGRTTSKKQQLGPNPNDENGIADQLKTEMFDNGVRFTTAEILDISEGTDSYL